jgi:hypothetical protein
MQQEWYLESKGSQTGPMTRTALISFLKSSTNPFQFSIWTPGLPHWKKLYFFEEILSELGMSRRTQPRAPLTGTVEIKDKDHKFVLQTAMIGPGGVGILNAKGLIPGQTIQLTLRSPAFHEPLRTSALVLYVRPDGVTGAKFSNMHIEAQSAIVDYVRQFEVSEKKEPEPELPKTKKVA